MANEDEGMMSEEEDMIPEGEINDELIDESPKYDDLVLEEPERNVDIATLEVSKDEVGSDDGDTVKKTDFQAALAEITPKFKNKRMDDMLQPIIKSRVFADNYLDLNYLLTMSLIEEQEDSAASGMGMIFD